MMKQVLATDVYTQKTMTSIEYFPKGGAWAEPPALGGMWDVAW